MHQLNLLYAILLAVLPVTKQPTNFISTIPFESNQLAISHITFGVFCGECSKNCATMYKYNVTSNTLQVDTKDTYYKNYGNIKFDKSIINNTKIIAASKLVQKIPIRFLLSNNQSQIFGCPDCDDGCGIYFEFQQDTLVKKIYIDYSTKSVDKDVVDFATSIVKTLTTLSHKK